LGDETTDLIIGIVVLGGIAFAIHAGYLGKALDSIGSVKLPGLPSGGGGGGGSSGGGAVVPTGSGITFAAAGDWGSGRNRNWQKVVAVMKTARPSVVLILGDMSYTNAGAFKPVTDALKAIPARVLWTQGNHDGGEYGSMFSAYSNSVTTIGNTSFMSINSNSTGSAVAYAKANMSKMTGRWKVVFMHHPAYTVKSDHGATMGSLIPVLEAGKVDLCLAGHNHNYQRFAPKAGVTYIVSGLGGESPYSVGANCGGCPALIKAFNKPNGASIFTTSSNAITGKFVGVDGAVKDSFQITKAGAGAKLAYVFSN
jgi:predicted phosphodiesterase